MELAGAGWGSVGRSLLLGAAFVDALGDESRARTESVGGHALEGVGDAVEVFGLRGSAPREAEGA